MKSRLRSTQGVVLRRYPFRETSLIATLFTEDFGKVRGLVKGIRTDPKRFGSPLDLFSLNRIVFYQRSHQALDLVSQVTLTDHFSGLGSDLVRFGAAGYVVDLVDAVTVDHDVDKPLFRLIADTLKSLQTDRDVDGLIRFFEVSLLKRIGLMPSLDVCNRCRTRLETGSVVFKLKEQGLLCGRCSGPDSEGLVLHRSSLDALSILIRNHPQESFLNDAGRQTKLEIKAFLRRIIDMHTGRRLRSVDFARKIEQNFQGSSIFSHDVVA